MEYNIKDKTNDEIKLRIGIWNCEIARLEAIINGPEYETKIKTCPTERTQISCIKDYILAAENELLLRGEDDFLRCNKRQCACCGNNTLYADNLFEICSVCGWKSDAVQEENPDCADGANNHSLNEYREIFYNTTANIPTLKLTPYDDRMCPIYKRVIDGELCYETALCMQGQFHISSVPEADYIKLKMEDAKKICIGCPYGNMD